MRKISAFLLGFMWVLLSLSCSAAGMKPIEPDSSAQYSAESVNTVSAVRENPGIQETEIGSAGGASVAAGGLQIKPAILLDQTYTIQIGIFDAAAAASAFASSNQFADEEAGIATVTLAGEKKYLLAYGMYSSESDAQTVADQFVARIQSASREASTLKVLTLAEIKAISETVNIDADVIEIDNFDSSSPNLH